METKWQRLTEANLRLCRVVVSVLVEELDHAEITADFLLKRKGTIYCGGLRCKKEYIHSPSRFSAEKRTFLQLPGMKPTFLENQMLKVFRKRNV